MSIFYDYKLGPRRSEVFSEVIVKNITKTKPQEVRNMSKE
jgi:hypothetical protein